MARKRKQKAQSKPIDDAVWESIKNDFEVAGMSYRRLAEKYDVTHTRIARRAKIEDWGKGLYEQTIRQKTELRIIGATEGTNSLSKGTLECIDDEAERRAKVRLRHREEWLRIVQLQVEAYEIRNDSGSGEDCEVCGEKKSGIGKAFERARFAKISAETMIIQQKGEAAAWGLDGPPVDVSQLTDKQLESLVKGKSPN